MQGTRNPVKVHQKNTIIHFHTLFKDLKLHSVMWGLNMGRRRQRMSLFPLCSRVEWLIILFIFCWLMYQKSPWHFCHGFIKPLFSPDLGHLIITGPLPKEANGGVYVFMFPGRCKPEQVETQSPLSSGSTAWNKEAPNAFNLTKIHFKPIAPQTRFRRPEK